MQNLNTIPIAGKFTDVAAAANTNFAAVRLAIEQLELSVSRSKGFFTSAAGLTARHPSPSVGDWAIVQVTSDNVTRNIIYKCSTAGVWSSTGSEWEGGTIDLSEYALHDDIPECGFYTCNTAAATAAKTVSATGFSLKVGGNIRILMANANTADNPTLNIGSTGAKPLYYDDEPASAENSWNAGETVVVFYNGTTYLATNSQGGGRFATNEKVNDVPITENVEPGGNGLPTSGAVYENVPSNKNSSSDADLEICDENLNVLARFRNGHIETKNFKSEEVPEMTTKESEDNDFSIEDEEGNAIVIFNNGHIKTKKFNSANIQVDNYLLTKFQGKKLAVVGDSISTYQGWLPSDVPGFEGTAYAHYYPNGDVNSVTKTWWYQVAMNLGILPANIANTSWSGGTVCGDSTSTSYGKPACSTKRVADIGIRGFSPDIIIVYISTNDWYQCGLSGYNIRLGDWKVTDPIPQEGVVNLFRSAYALMLAKLQTTYPTARIFCCTILDDYRRDEGTADDPSDNAWPSNNAAGITTKQWNDNIREIADAFACDVIDMHNCGITYFNIPSYAVDSGLHPNAAGHEMMARKVTSELMAKY